MKSRALIDDINGQPDAQEVRFTWMGTAYAIDLAEENYTVLATVIEQFQRGARGGEAGTECEAAVRGIDRRIESGAFEGGERSFERAGPFHVGGHGAGRGRARWQDAADRVVAAAIREA